MSMTRLVCRVQQLVIIHSMVVVGDKPRIISSNSAWADPASTSIVGMEAPGDIVAPHLGIAIVADSQLTIMRIRDWLILITSDVHPSYNQQRIMRLNC